MHDETLPSPRWASTIYIVGPRSRTQVAPESFLRSDRVKNSDQMQSKRPAHVYEVRPRKDKRGVDLISDAMPFFFPKLRSAISVEQVGMEAPACFPTTLKTFLQHSASLESFLKVKWQMMRLPKRSTIRTDVYEIRPRADKHGVDLVGDALPYSPMWYRGPKAITDAIDHATFYSRSHDAVIRVYDDVGNVIATHGACNLCAPQ